MPLSWMLIRSEDAASLMRLGILPGPPAKGTAVVLADMVLSAPSSCEDAASRVCQSIHETIAKSF